MALVILESPYAGDVGANVAYARSAMRDSILRGEHPIASHLLYTQPGILDDNVPEERERGIAAGLAWRRVADRAVFYIDRGWSGGMLAAREVYEREGFPFHARSIAAGNGTLPRDYNPYELALIERELRENSARAQEAAKGRGYKRNARSQHRETPHG